MKTIFIEGTFIGNREEHEPCVMVLGFFDGVHLGHRSLIDTAKKIAEKKGIELAVMTFFPHPSNILQTQNKITSYLTPLPDKQRLLKNMGVEKLYIVTFTEPFAELSPEDFIKRYVAGLHSKHVVAGFDFTYGYRGKGNMERMKLDGKGLFDVTTVAKKAFNGEKISSSKIRKLLDEGKVEDVHHFLGNHYSAHGMLERQSFDQNSGKTVAHIVFQHYYLPQKGLYIVEVMAQERIYQSISLLHVHHSCVLVLEGNIHIPAPVTIKWLAKVKALSPLQYKSIDQITKNPYYPLKA